MSQQKTIAFFGTCTASSRLVLVSKRISTPFNLREIRCKFAQGQQNLVALRFYYSEGDDAPSSGAPNGINILQDYGQVDYFVGDDDVKIAYHEIEVREGGMFLKVYAVNSDTFDHAVDVQMYIDIMERR